LVRGETLTRQTRFELHEETWAAYLNGGHRWGAFAVSGGLRTTYTRKTLDRSGYREDLQFNDFQAFSRAFDRALAAASAASLALPPGVAAGTPIEVRDDFVKTTTRHRYSGEDDDVNVTPAVGVTYDLPKHFQLFAHSSYVVKPSGFNALATTASASRYGREQIWATELGVRGQALNGRLQGQLTGYWNAIDDYQLELGFLGRVINAGRARARGAELEVAWQFMPGLAVSGNFGWCDTELTEFFPSDQAPFVPKYTGFIALDYRHRCGFGAHLEFKAIGERQYLADTSQDAYGEVNARLGYEQSHYGVYLFGRNLTDSKRSTQNDFNAHSTGAPRVLGVMAALKF
jgi:outer membrane receptor protein involved in Fe transport